ncbi:hypothetical protein WG66_008223 [Moniliophthora roreri]|nr:hypothetical protein WG66_008223 [Moniliophthora roreri]
MAATMGGQLVIRGQYQIVNDTGGIICSPRVLDELQQHRQSSLVHREERRKRIKTAWERISRVLDNTLMSAVDVNEGQETQNGYTSCSVRGGSTCHTSPCHSQVTRPEQKGVSPP